MPFLYFSRKSENRKESFLSEIPSRKPIRHDHSNQSSKIPESNTRNLPGYLISCIHYCCFYIRYDIERAKLARLFVAEGLTPEIKGETMEHSAEMAIDKLIQLEILQVLYQYGFPSQFLKLSDQFRTLSFNEFDEKHFTAIAADSPVRALIEDDGKNKVPNFSSFKIHTLFLIAIERRISSSNNGGLSRDYLKSICKLQHLLVLDLDGKLEKFPDDVGELVNLRYLSLNCSYLDQLPAAIGGLQTLEIKLCGKKFIELPPEFLNLQQLRHLLMSRAINDCEIRVPAGMAKLVNLQTLEGIYAGHQRTAEDLGELIQLRKLAVKRVASDHSDDLAAAVSKLRNLESLSLEAENSHCIRTSSLLPEFESFDPPPFLGELAFSDGLIEIPKWVFPMRDLTILTLSNSNLPESSIWVLQFLPKLKHLALYHACKGKKLSSDFCNAGGFPNLESLTTCSRFLVEWSEIVEGAFPCLKNLCFRNCVKLRFLPEGLQSVGTLEGLSLTPSYNDIGRRLNGEENYKIKHIPNVRIRELYFQL